MATINKEEALRRFMSVKRQKKQLVERMVEYAKEDFLRRTGKEATCVEVW